MQSEAVEINDAALDAGGDATLELGSCAVLEPGAGGGAALEPGAGGGAARRNACARCWWRGGAGFIKSVGRESRESNGPADCSRMGEANWFHPNATVNVNIHYTTANLINKYI